MKLTKEIQEFVPLLKKGFIYYRREEENGKYRIKTKNNEGIEYIVNGAFVNIIDLLDGKNSIASIVEQLIKKYPELTKDSAFRDILYVIKSLNDLQALSNYENPTINTIEVSISDNIKVVLCTYNVLDKVIDYMKCSRSINIYENPVSYFSRMDILKNRVMSNIEERNVIIYLSKNDEIVGTMIWIQKDEKDIELDSMIISEEGIDISTVMLVSVMIVSKVLKQKNIIAHLYSSRIQENQWVKKILNTNLFEKIDRKSLQLQGDEEVAEYRMYC